MNKIVIKRKFGRLIMGVLALWPLIACPLPRSTPYTELFKDKRLGREAARNGGAFTAIADDANGQLYIPPDGYCSAAGIFIMSSMYTPGLTLLISDRYILVTLSLGEKYGSIGIAWGSLALQSLYTENTACLDMEERLNGIFKIRNLDISLGMNIKYLKHE